MDAQLRGALMFVRFVAVVFMGMSVVELALYLGRTQIPPDAGEHSSFRAVGRFISGRRRYFDQGQSHRELDFRQVGMNF
jgi:hypothetical protein